MASKIIIPDLPRYYRLDDTPSYDTWTQRTIIHEIPTSTNTNINGSSAIRFEYKGEDYIRLGSPRSGFKVRARFLTHSAPPTAANANTDRNADTTLEANWFHHLWSRYEIKAGSETLELIDYPGPAMDIVSHLKGLDYRQRSGEVAGFIPDEGTGNASSGVAMPNRVGDAAGTTAANIGDAAHNEKTAAIHAVNAALRGGINNGYLRRKLKYNYAVAANNEYREVELFIPLNLMFGFCDSYDMITKYMPFTIELTRSAATTNAFFGSNRNTMTLELTDLTLHIEVYEPKPELQLTLDKRFEQGSLDVCYLRRWINMVNSDVTVTRIPETQFSHPRYIFIIAKGTTDEANQEGPAANYSLCRHCDIEDIRISLDSKWYPDKPFHTNFDQNKFSQFYDAYANICEVMSGSCGMTPKEFKELYTIFCIDLNDQKDKVPNAPTNLSIEIHRRGTIPTDNTNANTGNGINPRNVKFFYMIVNEERYSMDCKKKVAVKV